MTWETHTGEKLDVGVMSIPHIDNCIRMLENRNENLRERIRKSKTDSGIDSVYSHFHDEKKKIFTEFGKLNKLYIEGFNAELQRRLTGDDKELKKCERKIAVANKKLKEIKKGHKEKFSTEEGATTDQLLDYLEEENVNLED